MRYRPCTLTIRLSADSSLLCKGKTPPSCPNLSALCQTLCSWEISLIEGCQLRDTQMQIRGSRHPTENRTDFHPTGGFHILEGFMVRSSFFQLHPLFCFCLSPPPLLLSTPSLLCLCCVSSPRRSGLHETQVVEAAEQGFLQSYMDARPVQEKTSASSPQLTCPRDPDPHSPSP